MFPASAELAGSATSAITASESVRASRLCSLPAITPAGLTATSRRPSARVPPASSVSAKCDDGSTPESRCKPSPRRRHRRLRAGIRTELVRSVSPSSVLLAPDLESKVLAAGGAAEPGRAAEGEVDGDVELPVMAQGGLAGSGGTDGDGDLTWSLRGRGAMSIGTGLGHDGQVSRRAPLLVRRPLVGIRDDTRRSGQGPGAGHDHVGNDVAIRGVELDLADDIEHGVPRRRGANQRLSQLPHSIAVEVEIREQRVVPGVLALVLDDRLSGRVRGDLAGWAWICPQDSEADRHVGDRISAEVGGGGHHLVGVPSQPRLSGRGESEVGDPAAGTGAETFAPGTAPPRRCKLPDDRVRLCGPGAALLPCVV